MIQQRAAEANKAALEADKERDELHNQIEQIEEQLHPKRARTDDDAGDAHEMLAKRSLAQARTASCITRVLVWLGGFQCWCLGDSVLAVDVLVALINTLEGCRDCGEGARKGQT